MEISLLKLRLWRCIVAFNEFFKTYFECLQLMICNRLYIFLYPLFEWLKCFDLLNWAFFLWEIFSNNQMSEEVILRLYLFEQLINEFSLVLRAYYLYHLITSMFHSLENNKTEELFLAPFFLNVFFVWDISWSNFWMVIEI